MDKLIIVLGLSQWVIIVFSPKFELLETGLVFGGLIFVTTGLAIYAVRRPKKIATRIAKAFQSNGVDCVLNTDVQTSQQVAEFICQKFPWYVKASNMIDVSMIGEGKLGGFDLRVLQLVEPRMHGLKATMIRHTTAYIVYREELNLPHVSLLHNDYIKHYNYTEPDFYFGGVSCEDNVVFKYSTLCDKEDFSGINNYKNEFSEFMKKIDAEKDSFDWEAAYNLISSFDKDCIDLKAVGMLHQYSYAQTEDHIGNFKRRLTTKSAGALLLADFTGIEMRGQYTLFFSCLIPLRCDDIESHLFHIGKFFEDVEALNI